MKNKLEYLADTYNEQFKYMYHGALGDARVQVQTMGTNPIGSTRFGGTIHEPLVRVSQIVFRGAGGDLSSHPYDTFEEVRWEGRLLDWYKALANALAKRLEDPKV